MNHAATLMQTKKWCFWLNASQPDPTDMENPPRRFRVCIVVENEGGNFPTGGGDALPWYWSQDSCDKRNAMMGISEGKALDIVSSSMAAQMLRR